MASNKKTEPAVEPITITGVGNMVIDMDEFCMAAFELADANPDHPIEEEVAIMDVHDNPDAVIDGVTVFEVTSLPGGEVLIDFVDGSTQVVSQDAIPPSLNPFREGGIGMNQIPVYLETPTS